MFSKNYIFQDNNKKRCAYIKVSDTFALDNMKKGEWWLRHPSYFQYEEIVNGDKERGDREECLVSEQFSSEEEITKEIPFGNIGSISPNQTIYYCYKEYNPQELIDKIRLISFYRIDLNQDGTISDISEKMQYFGDSFSFVNMRLFKDKISKMGIEYEAKDVNYLPERYSGKVGIVGKKSAYSHQNEYRISMRKNEYGLEVQQNQDIHNLTGLLIEHEQTLINPKSTGEEKLSAHKETERIELELCKLRSVYKIIVNINQDVLSDIYPIKQLFEINNINELY